MNGGHVPPVCLCSRASLPGHDGTPGPGSPAGSKAPWGDHMCGNSGNVYSTCHAIQSLNFPHQLETFQLQVMGLPASIDTDVLPSGL